MTSSNPASAGNTAVGGRCFPHNLTLSRPCLYVMERTSALYLPVRAFMLPADIKALLCSDQAKPLISSTLEPESMVHVPDAFAHDNSAGMRPVVLVLVGVPGAGKSTFSAALQAASPGRWERVNQVKLLQLL